MDANGIDGAVRAVADDEVAPGVEPVGVEEARPDLHRRAHAGLVIALPLQSDAHEVRAQLGLVQPKAEPRRRRGDQVRAAVTIHVGLDHLANAPTGGRQIERLGPPFVAVHRNPELRGLAFKADQVETP